MSVARDEFDRLVGEWPTELDGWTLEVSSRMTSTAGYCSHKARKIRIAEWLILRASKAEVIDTVRHEVAHALIGADHHHDELWRFACALVGASTSRLYDVSLNHLTAAARRGRR